MTPKRITIHCSDSGPKTTFEDIENWHTIDNGWSDIGYHYVIESDGAVCSGRPLDKTGAHVLKDNKNNIGICLVGRKKFTEHQFLSLWTLLDDLCTKYDIGPDKIYGHYEFNSAKQQGKTCPNIRISDLLLWYVTRHVSFINKYMVS